VILFVRDEVAGLVKWANDAMLWQRLPGAFDVFASLIGLVLVAAAACCSLPVVLLTSRERALQQEAS